MMYLLNVCNDKCLRYGDIDDIDLAYASALFNSKPQIVDYHPATYNPVGHQLTKYNSVEHHPAAYYPVDNQSVEHNLSKQYRVRKKKLTFSERKHDRKFKFGLDITEQNPTNFNVFDGIFVIKNTVGLPNNINLFDFKK